MPEDVDEIDDRHQADEFSPARIPKWCGLHVCAGVRAMNLVSSRYSRRVARAAPRTVLQQRVKCELDRYARIKYHHLSRACDHQTEGGPGSGAPAPSRCHGLNRSSCARAETWWTREAVYDTCNAMEARARACTSRIASRPVVFVTCGAHARRRHAVRASGASARMRTRIVFYLSLIQQGQRSGARHDVIAVVHGSWLSRRRRPSMRRGEVSSARGNK